MLGEMKLETKILLVFLLPVLLVLVLGMFFYFAQQKTADEIQAVYQAQIARLETLKAALGEEVARDQVRQAIGEVRNAQEQQTQIGQQVRFMVLMLLQIVVVLLVALGAFFARQVRFWIERERADNRPGASPPP